MGMVALAIFSMALSLIQTPSASIGRATTQFLLPQLSAVKEDDTRFNAMAVVAVQANMLVGIGLLAGIVLLGAPLVSLVLGAKYAGVIPLLLAVAVLEAIRSTRARTGNGLASNLPRVLSIGLSWYAITQGHGVSTVLTIAVFAEVIGFTVGLLLMRSRARVDLKPLLPSLAAFGLLIACVAAYAPLGRDPGRAVTGILILGFFLALLSLRPLWRYLKASKMTTYAGGPAPDNH
jgi:O-antigen/teichoic acid export membrane protein